MNRDWISGASLMTPAHTIKLIIDYFQTMVPDMW